MTEGQQPTFEEIYAALEGAVQRLETGGLPLAEAIAVYEEGVRLAQQCRALLDAAELRVTTLAAELDGMMLRPLLDSEEDDEEP